MGFFFIKYLSKVARADLYIVESDIRSEIMADTYFMRQYNLFGFLSWHSSIKVLNFSSVGILFQCWWYLDLCSVCLGKGYAPS